MGKKWISRVLRGFRFLFLKVVCPGYTYRLRRPLTWLACNVASVARAVNGRKGHFKGYKDQEDQKTPEDPEVQTVRTLRTPTSAKGCKRL